MAYRVDLSRQARQETASYIQATSVEQAALWFEGLTYAITTLETFPERGKALPDHARYRQILYGNRPHVYRVIYRVVKRSRRVVVATIRHGARMGDGL